MASRAAIMQASDIPSMFRIRDEAFVPTQAPVSCLLFLPPFSPSMQQQEQERLEAQNGTLFFKAVADHDDKMIGCMRARMILADTAPNPAFTLPPWRESSGVEKEVWDRCWTTMYETKNECFKYVKHIYVDLVVTDPNHQRKGAARCLLNKLSDIADREELVILLVSTDTARPLYESASFVVAKEVVLEANGNIERVTFMIRRPLLGRSAAHA